MDNKKIKSALISVFDKTGLEEIVKELHSQNVKIYSTGGTQTFIENLNIPVVPVEDITSYPSILGGRVKTLHPKIFGGILHRRALKEDQLAIEKYEIPAIDLVIVDLYPFEDTVASGGTHEEIIEKIDIGGIALIRGAAKNYNDVIIVPSKEQYVDLLNILKTKNGESTLAEREYFAKMAFATSSHYDTHIFNYFQGEKDLSIYKQSIKDGEVLRYGENPHQKGTFFGKLDEVFDQVHGKTLSYNNLLDVDAAVNLMNEFHGGLPTFAILKHNNACGIASRETIKQAYQDALAADPVSAFGGILISNSNINLEVAEEINQLFCEVVIAPSFDADAIDILKSKKNRIILIQKSFSLPTHQYRSILNGILAQERDHLTDKKEDFKCVTTSKPTKQEELDLEFASKIAKHTKSNTIVLVKNGQLLASGTGQTSRVDALNQAIHKAKTFKFNLQGAVMASDAFFPFPDCVEIADNEGITAVVQPGGSIKDELSIEYCNKNNVSMVFTGTRHFKH